MNNLKSSRCYYCLKELFLIWICAAFPVSRLFSQAYFQQEVNYSINVYLNDKLHEFNAFETIEYINNSPDTIKFLYFHLWPNGYLNNSTQLASQLFSFKGKQRLFNDPELRGYIDSLDFKINNEKVSWSLLTGQPDICRIELNKPVISGDSISITTPFHVKIPKGVTSRLGHIGESYQISQWYPKPAVYDRNGWHQMPYLDQGEFYSEFGSFDVSITLPSNYTVGATGNLQNAIEVERLNALAADTAWEKSSSSGRNEFPASSVEMKTLRYTGSHIHDFAWFADKRFHVMKGRVRLPDSGREVITWVMFNDEQVDLWKNSLEYVNGSILYFSTLIGDYPYDTFTAVQSTLTAGAGMEYPGLTVIGLAKDGYDLDEVIAHEICHNWFYSALGSDERTYPFMDESIVSAYEIRYMTDRYPDKKLWEKYFKNMKIVRFLGIKNMPVQRINELIWMSQARVNLEQPINIPAQDFTYVNYGAMIYSKAAIGFNYLRSYLGNSLFDSTMHEYYRSWKSRHPQPDDLRILFESCTGKDLTWFFRDFIGTNERLDYKVIRYDNGQLKVKNRGELTSPVLISAMKGDSICFEKWVDGFEGMKEIDILPGDYSQIKIDPLHKMTELYRLNNNIRTSGIFRKADPLRFQLLFTVEDPDKRYLMFVPAVNWTRENGFMAGLSLNNGSLIPRRVEYFVSPFYTFKNPGIAGFGKVAINILPFDNFIRMATINLEGTQFGAPGSQNYQKGLMGLDIYLRNRNMSNPLTHKIYANYIKATNLYQITFSEKASINSYVQLGYLLDLKSLVNPFSILTSFESNKSYKKTAVEINYRLSYNGKDKGLDIRFFTGVMSGNDSKRSLYSIAPGGRGGREQYLYDGTYPDRFTVFPGTFLSRQMTNSEGGLVSPVNDSLGYSNWLISISFASNLPGIAGRMPVKPFANFLLNDHGSRNNSPFFYEAGLKAGFPGIFEIYVPLVVSGNINELNRSFRDRIRFVLNLDSFFRLGSSIKVSY